MIPTIESRASDILMTKGITYVIVGGNDTYGITGIPSTVGECEVVQRAGLAVSTKIVYPGSGREDA